MLALCDSSMALGNEENLVIFMYIEALWSYCQGSMAGTLLVKEHSSLMCGGSEGVIFSEEELGSFQCIQIQYSILYSIPEFFEGLARSSWGHLRKEED